MTVDPRHLDPPSVPAAQQPAAYQEAADPGPPDPAATQPEPEYPTAEYPVPPYPGSAPPEAASPEAAFPGSSPAGAAPQAAASQTAASQTAGWPAAAYRVASQPAPAYPGAAYRAGAQPGAAHAAVPHARMLAATADRERAVDVLKAGFAEGRLTQAEYNDRVGQVYASRTYGELAALVGDLPAGPLGGPAHYLGGGYPVQRAASGTNSLAVASLVCGLGEFFTMGLTAIPAVICGHMARRQMRETGERGDGMAVAGLFLGWAGIGLFIGFITVMIIAASTLQARTGVLIPNAPGPAPGG